MVLLVLESDGVIRILSRMPRGFPLESTFQVLTRVIFLGRQLHVQTPVGKVSVETTNEKLI